MVCVGPTYWSIGWCVPRDEVPDLCSFSINQGGPSNAQAVWVVTSRCMCVHPTYRTGMHGSWWVRPYLRQDEMRA